MTEKERQARSEDRFTFFVGALAVITIACFFIFTGWGHVKRNQFISKCTESVNAGVSGFYDDEYLYAPYHGGRVTTEHRYYTTYTVTVNGKDYWITLMTVNLIGKDKSGVFKYNPDNPDHSYFDMTEVCGNDYIEPFTTVWASVAE